MGGGTAMLQQGKTRVEAAPSVGVRGRPAVDDGERTQTIRSTDGEIETRQAAQRMADEVTGRRVGRIEHGQYLVGHLGDAVVRRPLPAIAARAGLVLGD